MREIILTRGHYAQVDDEDFEWLSQFKWYCGNGYAMRGVVDPVTKKQRTIYMHHEIMKPSPGYEVDHVNGRGTDNQRENLRIALHQQNGANKRPQKGKRFKGLCWNKQLAKWQAHIGVNGKVLYLGLYTSEREAALAYDAAARKHFGEFAHLNYPNQGEQTALLSQRV